MVKVWDIVEYHRTDTSFPEYQGDLGIVLEARMNGETQQCRVAWLGRHIGAEWFDCGPSNFAVVFTVGEVLHG